VTVHERTREATLVAAAPIDRPAHFSQFAGAMLVLVLLLMAVLLPLPELRPVELTLPSGDARLAATLVLPEGRRPPYPAVVLVHGSGRMTAQDLLKGTGARLTRLGLAVLAYDKRGVGRSTGEYASIGPANSTRMFELLAADALAGTAALKARRDIDPQRIGLLGISQGGWIAPLAATRSADVAFVVTISGPAVSVGEEIAYSRLAGEDPGSVQGLSESEVTERMRAFQGPHGYDPAPTLATMRVPSLWIIGERDRSIPVRRTLEVLGHVKERHGRPITTHVIPGVNHGLRDPVTGAQPDIWGAVADWLTRQGVVRPSSSGAPARGARRAIGVSNVLPCATWVGDVQLPWESASFARISRSTWIGSKKAKH
jgi:dipeptidyl aminopeptidase/acylaminoacyl peptidase